MKLLKAISEIISSKLILEISEKRILELIKKYQKEKPNLTPNVIRAYIDRFEEIKNSPQITQKDIYQLSWMDLVRIVDASQKKDIKAGKMDVSIPDENLIYDKNNIRVYKASNRESCIKYGDGYNFCISARGDGEMYQKYRIDDDGSPYFVFFDNITKDDPNHLLVVFYYKTKNNFSVTDAKNEGEKYFGSKDELISSYPQLKPIINLFNPIPIEKKEKMKSYLDEIYDEQLKLINKLKEKLREQTNYLIAFDNDLIKILQEKKNDILTNKKDVFRVEEYIDDYNPYEEMTHLEFFDKGTSIEQVRKEVINDYNNMFDVDYDYDVDVIPFTKETIAVLNHPLFGKIVYSLDYLKKIYQSDLNKISMGLYDDLELPKSSINDLVK
jgi:hypothetical protein